MGLPVGVSGLPVLREGLSEPLSGFFIFIFLTELYTQCGT